ncbi:hypothetical protein EON73_00165 [bacterium]|nr:MAG: hypothetical protein EON73_00165 [bacterium]
MSTFFKSQDLGIEITKRTPQNYEKNSLIKISQNEVLRSQVKFDLRQLSRIWRLRRPFISFASSSNSKQFLLSQATWLEKKYKQGNLEDISYLYKNAYMGRRQVKQLTCSPVFVFKVIKKRNSVYAEDRVKFDSSKTKSRSISNLKTRNLLTRKFSKKKNKLHFVKKIKSIFSLSFFFDSHPIFSSEQMNNKALSKQPPFPPVPQLKYKNLNLKKSAFYRLNSNQKLTFLYPTNLDKMSFLSLDLANLGLSLNTYTLLKQRGVDKIGNLLEYSPKALLQLVNKNREMSIEIKECFLHLGLRGKGTL